MKTIDGIAVPGGMSDEIVNYLNARIDDLVEQRDTLKERVIALEAENKRIALANELADEMRVAIWHLVKAAIKGESDHGVPTRRGGADRADDMGDDAGGCIP